MAADAYERARDAMLLSCAAFTKATLHLEAMPWHCGNKATGSTIAAGTFECAAVMRTVSASKFSADRPLFLPQTVTGRFSWHREIFGSCCGAASDAPSAVTALQVSSRQYRRPHRRRV